jgi:cytochrome b6-f complex iron-sulfur subunit
MKDEDEEADARDRSERRDFLHLAIVGSATTLGAMSAYPTLQFLTPKDDAPPGSVEAGKLDDFARGSARALFVGGRPALVLRLADGTLRAFVALCTHLECVVKFVPVKDRIECACHGGVFATDGRNLAGPPPRPLEPLAVHVVDGMVTVSEV